MADEKTGIVDRAKAALAAARRRWRLLDHVMDMVSHYGNVQGGVLAGAVTYFGFLSFFPILALSFAVVGYLARWFPDAEDSLVTAIQQVFPASSPPRAAATRSACRTSRTPAASRG